VRKLLKVILWPFVFVWYLIFFIPSLFVPEGSGCQRRGDWMKNYLFGTPIPNREKRSCGCW
jgi:hypothetical protein